MLDRVGPLALDGPVASGKSSVGRNIANRLGWVFADTGLMYRAIGYLMSLHEIKSGGSKNLLEMAHSATIDISDEQVVLNGETITPHIRSPEIANNAAIAAESSEIRNLLVSQQRELASKTRGKIVMTPHGFINDNPNELKNYKNDHAKEWSKVLGGMDFEIVEEKEETAAVENVSIFGKEPE